ncbi:hypothetical protein MWN34_12610 [Ancylobacter sp. 6x-1]|uniref:DUF2868 domain-containing protein n=1 Tax=Ancylobacter crimeensis TaxID=2579147 RepID=A0ABT0DCY1_9HYPH|nr:hypothetical protein [Ancylobacter crimeensis]MCK0197754.1 hypothetical protein [Ancylobacter crimeensis]
MSDWDETIGLFKEIAIDDVRSREDALIAHIRSQENQALSLLSLCSTLAIACASGVAAGLGTTPIASRLMSYGFGAAFVSLLIGAGISLWTLRSTPLALVGRDPQFWRCALFHDERKADAILDGYMHASSETMKFNDHLSLSLSGHLKWARLFLILAPVAALCTIILAPPFLSVADSIIALGTSAAPVMDVGFPSHGHIVPWDP